MIRACTLVALACLFAGSPGLLAQQALQTLTPAEAAEHIGERATVCGRVESASYASRSPGQPTFLNFGRPYPDQLFTVVIWGSDRARFATPPEVAFKGADVCVTGVVREYRGRPEIVVSNPSAIWRRTGS